MIMGGDKKKMAQVIVAVMDKKDPARSNAEAFKERAYEPEQEEIDPGLLSAAEEVQAAINGKDAVRLAKALKDFIYICDEIPEEMEEEEEEKPSPILG
jgi:hypothetical protein